MTKESTTEKKKTKYSQADKEEFLRNLRIKRSEESSSSFKVTQEDMNRSYKELNLEAPIEELQFEDTEFTVQVQKEIQQLRESGRQLTVDNWGVGYFLLRHLWNRTFEEDADFIGIRHPTLIKQCAVPADWEGRILSALRSQFGSDSFPEIYEDSDSQKTFSFENTISQGFRQLSLPMELMVDFVLNVIASVSYDLKPEVGESKSKKESAYTADLFYPEVLSLTYLVSPYELLGICNQDFLQYPMRNSNTSGNRLYNLIFNSLWDEKDESKMEYFRLLINIAALTSNAWKKFYNAISVAPSVQKALTSSKRAFRSAKQINHCKLPPNHFSSYNSLYYDADFILSYFERWDYDRLYQIAQLAVAYEETERIIRPILKYGGYFDNDSILKPILRKLESSISPNGDFV